MANNAIRAIGVSGAALLSVALGACSTPPNAALDEARAAVQTVRADPDVQAYAPVRLDEAESALQRAAFAWEEGADPAQVEHLAYVASQRAAVASARAAEKKAQQQVAAMGDERQRIQLDARTRESAAARQAAAEAQRQAEELQRQLAELLQARETERGLVLTLGDILFDVDRAELNPGGEQQVTRVADFLREFPDRQVLIEGHTDSTGSAEYNRQLSQRRAASVEHFLISQGVDARRIDIRGYGRDYPVASNDTGAGRQQNRRVEIVILKQGMTDAPRPAAGPI